MYTRYTAVLVAVPLELTSISFSGFELPHMLKRAYQTTWTTYVTGTLRPGYFGVHTLPQGTCGTALNVYSFSEQATMRGTLLMIYSADIPHRYCS